MSKLPRDSFLVICLCSLAGPAGRGMPVPKRVHHRRERCTDPTTVAACEGFGGPVRSWSAQICLGKEGSYFFHALQIS